MDSDEEMNVIRHNLKFETVGLVHCDNRSDDPF
jgi:hypothetical protein